MSKWREIDVQFSSSTFYLNCEFIGVPGSINLWPLLVKSQLPEVTLIALTQWREALQEFAQAGRRCKPVLAM